MWQDRSNPLPERLVPVILRSPLLNRLTLIIVALSALFVLPLIAEAKPKQKSALKIGFAEHSFASAAPAAFWADVAALRVSTLRWDLQWDRIAPTRPQRPCLHTDPAYRWAETDAFMRGAREAGLADEVMFTVWRTPAWASSLKNSRGRVQEMPRVREWRCFVQAATIRYNGRSNPLGESQPLPRVRAWEAWNEPNGIFAFQPQRQGGKNVSMRNYTILLNELHKIVKKNHGRSSLVVGGSLYKQGSRQGVHPVAFMRGMKANKARFDVLSIHPYNNVPRLGVRDGRTQSRTNPRFIAVGNIGTFVNLSNQIFGKRYPIWVTEWGWQTRPPAAAGYPTQGQYGVTNAQQARFLRQSIAELAKYRQVKRAMWFLMRDDPPCSRPCQTPWTSGVLTYDEKRKASWNAWRQARANLR
jgi:hypothetical protein